MLGLGEHLARDGAGSAVSSAITRSSLGPAGESMATDADELQLRLGDVGVAGSDDAVDARHGLGAERHRRDRAGAADREDAVDAGQRRRGEHRVATADRVRVGGEQSDDLVHAGDARRDRAHQHAARIAARPPGA